MGRYIDINSSFAEISSAGEQLSRLASEFAEQAEKTRHDLEALMDDPSTYGTDKPGRAMSAKKPDLEGLYTNHREYGERGEKVGTDIRSVMSMLESGDIKDGKDMDGVEA